MDSSKHAKWLAPVASDSWGHFVPPKATDCWSCQRVKRASGESACFTYPLYANKHPKHKSPNMICHFKTTLITLLSHHKMLALKLTNKKLFWFIFWLFFHNQFWYYPLFFFQGKQIFQFLHTVFSCCLSSVSLSLSWSRLLCLLIPRATAPVWAAVNHLCSACCQNQPPRVSEVSGPERESSCAHWEAVEPGWADPSRLL